MLDLENSLRSLLLPKFWEVKAWQKHYQAGILNNLKPLRKYVLDT